MKTATTAIPTQRYVVMMAILAFLGAFFGVSSPIAPVRAETNDERPVGTKIQDQADMCRAQGGALVVTDWGLDAGGDVAHVTTQCFGGGGDGTVCILTPNAGGCAEAMTLRPESVAVGPADTADPGENPDLSAGVTGEPAQGVEVTASVSATSDEQMLACESLGGVATVVTDGSIAASELHCRGGVLDGMTCIVGHYDSTCTFFRITMDPGVRDGIRAGSLADTLENVPGGGRIVLMSQSGSPVDNAATQAEACGVFGGRGTTYYEFNEEGEAVWAESSCEGGALDGMHCGNDSIGSVCWVERVMAEQGPQVDFSAGNEVPVESAPVAPSPTVAPTEIVLANPTPTVEPTVMPTIEPTVGPTEPVDPPTFPTPPTDDVVAPPGEAEDPAVEPTSTPVILL